MPKPLLLARPSGLYARFLVPLDLRSRLGCRFIVRALGLPSGDRARLAAACMSVALSDTFRAMRAGRLVDKKELDELLRKAALGQLRELTLENISLPNGERIGRAQVDTPHDAALLASLLGLCPPSSNETEPADQAAGSGWRNEVIKGQVSQAVASSKSGPTLSQAIDQHLEDLRRAKRDPKTIIESRQTLRILLGLVGDLPAAGLTVDHVRSLLDGVQHWPKNATQRAEYRTLSVKQTVALSKANGEPPPKAWTLSKHWDRMAVFVRHLHAAGVLDRDLMAAIVRPSAKTEAATGRPFSHAELQTVFGAGFVPWASKWPHRWFGPMIGLYSGARVTEVAQLRVADIQSVEGIWGFVVTTEGEGNKVKNQNSRRFVPLAQPLLDAGFMAYVEDVRTAGHERLFPNLPNSTGLGLGRQLSRQFSAYVKDQGIVDPGMGFHAFRHYLITHLDRALAATGMKPEQREPVIGRISGHYKPPGTTLRRVYVDRDGLPVPAFCEPETLQERVDTLALFTPSVVLPTYCSSQFGAQLKRASVLAAREARAVAARRSSP